MVGAHNHCIALGPLPMPIALTCHIPLSLRHATPLHCWTNLAGTGKTMQPRNCSEKYSRYLRNHIITLRSSPQYCYVYTVLPAAFCPLLSYRRAFAGLLNNGEGAWADNESDSRQETSSGRQRMARVRRVVEEWRRERRDCCVCV